MMIPILSLWFASFSFLPAPAQQVSGDCPIVGSTPNLDVVSAGTVEACSAVAMIQQASTRTRSDMGPPDDRPSEAKATQPSFQDDRPSEATAPLAVKSGPNENIAKLGKAQEEREISTDQARLRRSCWWMSGWWQCRKSWGPGRCWWGTCWWHHWTDTRHPDWDFIFLLLLFASLCMCLMLLRLRGANDSDSRRERPWPVRTTDSLSFHDGLHAEHNSQWHSTDSKRRTSLLPPPEPIRTFAPATSWSQPPPEPIRTFTPATSWSQMPPATTSWSQQPVASSWSQQPAATSWSQMPAPVLPEPRALSALPPYRLQQAPHVSAQQAPHGSAYRMQQGPHVMGAPALSSGVALQQGAYNLGTSGPLFASQIPAHLGNHGIAHSTRGTRSHSPPIGGRMMSSHQDLRSVHSSSPGTRRPVSMSRNLPHVVL